MADGARDPHEDRLGTAWQEINQRDRTVLELRAAGETLEQVGARLGVTRERVRQLKLKAESALIEAAESQFPHLREDLLKAVGDEAAVPDRILLRTVGTRSTVALSALLRGLGFMNPRTWAGELEGWWTQRQGVLDVHLRDIAAHAPFPSKELQERATAAGLAADLPLPELFSCAQSPVMPGPTGGWVRRSTKVPDAALLWLATEKEPRSSGEIAEAIGWASQRALREALRRDDRFVQRRPEGAWVLPHWKAVDKAWSYRSAFDALVDVLHERGPLTFDELAQETMRRYPVSRSWITQCLSSHRVGRTETGLYDLVERGALPIEDGEPRRPDNIVELHDSTIFMRLRVDSELLRGSSVAVSRWLTWRLGLNQPSTETHFQLRDGTGEVVVRRNIGSSTVSSLRAAAQWLGLVPGCHIFVALRPQQLTADARHGCTGRRCPAGCFVPDRLDELPVRTSAVTPER